MKVILAGHNVDKDALKGYTEGKISEEDLTPETISAAYARISRDPRAVTELRQVAREEVARARASNRNIVFGMGHHSVAEHVKLNFDILGVSRLAIEALEEARLCAYTEKSQRYITLDGDYVTPKELDPFSAMVFHALNREQVELYNDVFPKLHEFQVSRHNPKKKKMKQTVEGWAKEDARYILSMATEGQLGFSPNARNLEYIIRKLRHNPLDEVRELSSRLLDEAKKIVPSLVILADSEEFSKAYGATVSDNALSYRQSGELSDYIEGVFAGNPPCSGFVGNKRGNVNLLGSDPDPDTKVIASLLHSYSRKPYCECLGLAEHMKCEGFMQQDFIRNVLKNMTMFDSVPREFEMSSFDFEISLSSSAFAQMKRHRVMTLLKQGYDPSLGYVYPGAVSDAGLKGDFERMYDISSETYSLISDRVSPEVAEYALTNGHMRRILVRANLRELYHISRLRMDGHAQWDIRDIAGDMISLVKEKAPVTAMLACGKDGYDELRGYLFAGKKS